MIAWVLGVPAVLLLMVLALDKLEAALLTPALAQPVRPAGSHALAHDAG
jgi:hypothetical protein